MYETAQKMNKFIVHIICEGREDAFDGVTFISLVDAFPRIGEKIAIEDGNVCEVVGIIHKQSVIRENGEITSIILVPNVMAKLQNK
jgi:hypothetical protein